MCRMRASITEPLVYEADMLVTEALHATNEAIKSRLVYIEGRICVVKDAVKSSFENLSVVHYTPKLNIIYSRVKLCRGMLKHIPLYQ